MQGGVGEKFEAGVVLYTGMDVLTTTNDLAAAVSSGLLVAKGQRRGRRYVAGDRLFELVASAVFVEISGPQDVARAVIVSELSRRLTITGEALGIEDGK